ncbi:sodium-dependent transporter [Clostridium sp. MB40-C1]|uniref:sodium-dependent transporter n=1 Tax=Clostridium sp. MB40-C1 TaxID=3070996 RepID=UPI0027DF9B4F|nr:sodium-dependent transporter [Clostridium sp. MB40-C1]WMJ79997.1 sodium-dependent transporter [Clostridium sp. MB40-C1]
MDNKRREGFSSGLAAFFATLGAAVGLGNIWKFPYVVGENGGAAFLLIYIVCIALVGLPVMISEFFIGRKTRKNVVGAVKQLNNGKVWTSIGVFSLLGSYFILFFYSCVGGWVYSYVFKILKGDFAGATSETVAHQFTNTTMGPIDPVIWQIVVVIVVSTILIFGVKNGIEKITKTLMPVLLVLIVICDIRALTLPGTKESLAFLFKADFSKVTSQTILIAMGLAFFKLSVGMGTMVTYGSYFTEKDNMIGTASKVAISDLIVSLLVGLAVFSSVFTFGMKPSGGPGLLFMTIPLVFSKIPFGNILLVAFFILASIAATTAMTSMFEVPVAYYSEERGMSRKKAVIINGIIIIVFGILATLSVNNDSLLGEVKIFGKGFFDLFDYLSSNVILPLGGLFIAILVGYFVPKEEIKRELTNNGELKTGKIIDFYYFILRYVTPVILIIVFLSSIGIFR